jgi:2-keto-4-pentenoate hydratase/2-oxohepta-3-ene-1,7-dioic acid hydratase in catechol pathway
VLEFKMKLASFRVSDSESWGVVEGEVIADVGMILSSKYPTLRSVIAGEGLAAVHEALAHAPRWRLNEIRWLPPIVDPGKILCIGLNYETHRSETGRPKAAHPAIFTRFADTQIGHCEPIVRPHVSTSLDYEGELAIVIGRPGRYITPAEAMNHVAGYACYNDATLRDWQQHTHQFTPGKNFPGTGAFGPYVLTADEVADYRAFQLITRLNGDVVQSAGLEQLIFPIRELIAYCSAFTPLSAGDVVATGTPGGVGFKRTPPLFLRPGDALEVEITGLGTLSNSVADEAWG